MSFINFSNHLKTRNQKISLPILDDFGVELFVKREDEIHPYVSGNKFRKLKYNILEAKQQQKDTLLTFGGAFSNHILATAVAGKQHGFKTIGIVRGEELGNNLSETLANNITLKKAYQNGMEFLFVSRTSYQNKINPDFLDYLSEEFGDFYLIPEGGTNELAIKGCEEILTVQDTDFNYICSSVGTGGTITGLINSTENHQTIIGYSALKGDFLKTEIDSLVKTNKKNWELNTDYTFGGYAKVDENIIDFINEFKTKTGILLDPIYTSKMIFGILDMVKKNEFKKNSKILAIHTGGVQGIDGMNKKLQKQGKTTIII